MTIRSTAVAFALLLAIAAAPLAARAAQTPLPGQPGGDTSVGEELRAQPYPAFTERSQQAEGFAPMTTARNTTSVYGSLTLPANLIYN